MNKTTRFTLRELWEAAVTYQPDLRYKTVYYRFNTMKKNGELPEDATAKSLTWEHGKAILRRRANVQQGAPRQQAVAILRKAMKDDGIF